MAIYLDTYQSQVNKWKKLRQEGVSLEVCQEFVGISRATYYRYLKILKGLDKGITPPSKRPKVCNKPRWGEREKQLVLGIRKNPETRTYGKDKIGVILRRDHGLTLSNSTVGSILNLLKQKGLITKSVSAVRVKRKRQFHGRHAERWSYKEYKGMVIGERV